jgi:drug/metabolite transporter (DMT)-like permease
VGLQAIGAIGSGEPGSAPDTPSRGLALGLLVGGAVSLGISEAVVLPELIVVVKKAQVTLLSMTIALIVVLGTLAGTGVRGHVATLRRADRRFWIPAVVAGIAVFGAEELFLMAVSSLPVLEALVLASVAPILLVVVGVVRGEVRPDLLLVVGLVAVLVGFYCLTPGQTWFGGITAPGIWLGLASSACMAIAFLCLAACRPHASSGPTVLVLFVSAALSALVLCLSLGIIPGELLFQREEVLGGVMYAAIAGAVVPVVVATWAVPLLGVTRVAAFEVLAPAIGVCAALAWGEAVINVWTVVGVVLVAAGLFIGFRSHVRAHGDIDGPPEPQFFSHS